MISPRQKTNKLVIDSMRLYSHKMIHIIFTQINHIHEYIFRNKLFIFILTNLFHITLGRQFQKKNNVCKRKKIYIASARLIFKAYMYIIKSFFKVFENI